jgi:hypothetical protein
MRSNSIVPPLHGFCVCMHASVHDKQPEIHYTQQATLISSEYGQPTWTRQDTISASWRGPAHNRKWISMQWNSCKEWCYCSVLSKMFWALCMHDIRVLIMRKNFSPQLPLSACREPPLPKVIFILYLHITETILTLCIVCSRLIFTTTTKQKNTYLQNSTLDWACLQYLYY